MLSQRDKLYEKQSFSISTAFLIKLKTSVTHFATWKTRRECAAADAAKWARTSLDVDMNISAVETLRDAQLKVNVALHSADTTLRWTHSEAGSESHVVTKVSELKSLKDKRVHTEVYDHRPRTQTDQWQVRAEATGRCHVESTVRATWLLGRHARRRRLREHKR